MYVPDDENYIVDGENYAPPKPAPTSKKKKPFPAKIFIVIGIALVAGVSVYFISTLLFGGKSKTTKGDGISLTLELENTIVKDTYSMISYGRNPSSMNKFLKEQSVSLNDFSNYEKFYYALSLSDKKDFYDTKVTRDQKKIYAIDEDTVTQLMKKYFGSEVVYLRQGTIPIRLPFMLDDGNFLQLIYNTTDKAFTSTVSKQDSVETNVFVPTYLTKLEKAIQKEDGSIQLVERVIYLTSSVNLEQVSYSIYKDSAFTMPIVKNKMATTSELAANPIQIDSYLEQANSVTYTFKKEKDHYYFYRSEIEE